ncbi:MAG: peptide ABC transporter substrate-binding protein, partial [Armatimonadetes bacterium]|nr:peptide ABC transporter substrate-binding protein [Armatimonadota bacterium]
MRKPDRETRVLVALSIILMVAISAIGSATAAPARQVLRLNLFQGDPPSLDPAQIDNVEAGTVSKQLFEGLTRLDQDGNAIPGVAERWQVTGDGKVYTFFLRRNARWSNGDPVTAHDFVYAWLRQAHPKFAAPLVDNLFFIANAGEYNAGKISDPAQVGVRARDDFTLEIRLHTPAPFFPKLLAFFSLMPVSPKVDQQNPKWMNEAATFVSNGPFRLAQWVHEQRIVLERNPNYWARDRVKLDAIEWTIVANPNTTYQMFSTGQLDIVVPPTELAARLLGEKKAAVFPRACTFFLRFNNKVSPRDGITRRILQGGEIPLRGFIPHGLSSGTGEFRKQAGDIYKDNDVTKAREHLQQGLKELGLSAIPELTMRTSNRPTHTKVAQATQAQWKSALQVTVKIEVMEHRAYVAAVRRAKDYVLGPFSTCADYDDAFNLMTQFVSDDFFNATQYANANYDRLIRAAAVETNPQRRTAIMTDAERILIQQDMAIAPLFTLTAVVVQNPKLKNIYRYAVAEDDYRDA